MTPRTPRTTDTETKSSMDDLKPKKASDVRTVLQDNGMIQGDKQAFSQYQDLETLVDEILGGYRESAMKPEDEEALSTIREQFEFSTETTFLVNFMTKLIADKRLVHTTEIVDPTEAARQWIERAWTAEHLRTSWQAPFRLEALPPIETKDKALKELLKNSPRVTKPSPDMTFGMHKEAFTGEEQSINNKLMGCVEACPQSVHTFAIVECKVSGPIIEAMNQACRAGAALVNTRRFFNSKALPDNTAALHSSATNAPSVTKPSADLQSIAFSIVLNAQLAYIYVHWAEVMTKGEVRFHMYRVRDFSLASSGNVFTKLRRDVDNILDWGVLRRKREVQGVLERIKRKADRLPDDDVRMDG